MTRDNLEAFAIGMHTAIELQEGGAEFMGNEFNTKKRDNMLIVTESIARKMKADINDKIRKQNEEK